jgi:murein DD-endopeptidase MepM/ murein hydrolase activator NlpD
VGSFAIHKNGQWVASYGLKAFSPVAAGYGYSHCDDFGVSRSFGFHRKHLGNDLMGSLGTPIVAVEGGVVEAMGWNRYGGWRVGIRSFDSKRYYYYAHLQKDTPFAPGLAVGQIVQAGDLIGFMGRTGYSDKENVNNIETVHLHFGIQLVFDESQKECNSEIWIDVYDIVRLLNAHRVSYQKENGVWKRVYPFVDLDTQTLLNG